MRFSRNLLSKSPAKRSARAALLECNEGARRTLCGLSIAAALLTASCGASSVPPIEKHHIHGVIQSLDAKDHTATIKHQKIEGFMDAMTMEFPVKSDKEFTALRVGETIDGTVFVQDTNFWVGEIQEVKH
jgi:Cu/Ag efflux protein CusF